MHINDLKVIWHWSLRRIYLNIVTKPGQWMLKLEKKTTWLITTFTHALIQTYSITFYLQCWWILNKEKKSKININCDIRSSIQNKVFFFVVSNICVFILKCITFLFMFNFLYNIWNLCVFFCYFILFVIVVAGNTVNKCKDLASTKSIPGKRLIRMLWI